MTLSVRSQRHRLKNAYFQTLGRAHVDSLLRWRYASDSTVLVLNFHRVSPQRNPYWPPLPPEAFSALVGDLASTCLVRTFAELGLPRGSSAPQVVLSFDDGCRDFVEYAMPILDQHQLRVNHNVIVQSVQEGTPPWIIRVVDAMNAAPTERVRALRIPGFDVRLEGADDLSKVRYGTQLSAHLKSLAPAERDISCEDIAALLAETDPAHFTAMMTRSDVEAIGAVHEIGGHSYSHEMLSLLSDSEVAADLDRCEAFFMKLGYPMKVFAFPYGGYRSGQIETVQARGVEHVLLVGEQPARTGQGVYTRITMYGDSAAELRLRAAGHRL